MLLDVPDKDVSTVWLGHLGGGPGGTAVLAYDVKRQTYAAVALNKKSPTAPAVVNMLFKELDALSAN